MVCMEQDDEEGLFSENESRRSASDGAHYDASHLDVNRDMDRSFLDIDKSHLQSLPNISTAVLPDMEDQTLNLLPPTQYPRKKSYAPSYQ